MNHFLKLAFLYCNTNNHCSDVLYSWRTLGVLEGQYYTTHNCLNLPLAYIRSSWREANIISFNIIFKIKLLILQQRLKQNFLAKTNNWWIKWCLSSWGDAKNRRCPNVKPLLIWIMRYSNICMYQNSVEESTYSGTLGDTTNDRLNFRFLFVFFRHLTYHCEFFRVIPGCLVFLGIHWTKGKKRTSPWS